ncbi:MULTISPECIES: c-type cytochrome biogenesis protein CcsB [unclassified Janibacter]|uniref:c-type cytochrome biogenesis protein CcsB n=1 Tax=unclassified Janibacter TaxID=2649294 RepID=UPI003D059228
MTNETLATYANLSIYSAMGVLTLAMIGYALYLAGLVPQRGEAALAETETRVRERVGSGVRSGGAADGGVAGVAPVHGTSGRVALDASTPARARKAAGVAQSLSWLGAILLVAAVALRGLSVQRAPLGNMHEFAVAGAMFVMVGFCLWGLRRDLRWLGLFITAPVLLTLGMAITVWYTEAAELLPSLKSYWLVIHVTVATLAVAMCVLGFAVTALYLAKDTFIERGRSSFLDRLPAAKELEKASYGIHIVAFPLWTFTLIAGAIWAQEAWGSYWNWDPKEVWTFVIWVVYAAYLHARATTTTARRTAAWIAIAGFACIVINYTVVNMYFVGQHSYSGIQ